MKKKSYYRNRVLAEDRSHITSEDLKAAFPLLVKNCSVETIAKELEISPERAFCIKEKVYEKFGVTEYTKFAYLAREDGSSLL